MTFYERYAQICAQRGMDPCSQKTSDLLGVTRATISTWNKKNTAPKGETVQVIADALGTSTDYLLGRTDDDRDFSNPDLIAELAGPALDAFGGDVKRALAFQQSVADDVKREQAERHQPEGYDRLDNEDKLKVAGYIAGLLAADKYMTSKEKQA